MSSDPFIVPLKDHAARHQTARPPALLVKALNLSPEQAAELYVTDTQSYSNGCQIVQLHYMAVKPSPEVQRFRGTTYLMNPLLPTEILTVAKSFPYEAPIVSPEFPIQFQAEQCPKAKFSRSRQGFVARVFCPFNDVNVSTHRKIDCSKSHFGQSIYMKEMFQLAANAKGLDTQALFPTFASKKFCHVFFVSHSQMRLIPTIDEPEYELVYLGSLKQQTVSWADEDEEEMVLKVRDMNPCEANLPVLEALRPQYYNHTEAQALFEQGQPLIAWVPNKDPTRLVPSSWDRKEQLRGNVPNLKLAWYSLLDEGRADELKEVLDPSQHHLLTEYQQELETMLDSTENNHGGFKPAKSGSLISHLLERYQVFMKESDPAGFLEKAGKATGPILKTMKSYATKIVPEQQIPQLTKLLRKMCWEQIEAKKVYTLIAEYKRFLAPPVVRRVIDEGKVDANTLPLTPVSAPEPIVPALKEISSIVVPPVVEASILSPIKEEDEQGWSVVPKKQKSKPKRRWDR